MTKYELIHSLNLEQLAYLLTIAKIDICKNTAEKLGCEFDVSEEAQSELLETMKKFLESEVPSE